ncbi:retrovirus-related pol polyprotein from transposon TNT 1-94 [Tanacetum coccineum]
MSDNISFDLQIEIIKKVCDVKSLVRFRSVSKPWKSFIDSSQFIKGYGARHTQPHSHILSLSQGIGDELRYICLVDDDNETFKVQQQEFAPFVLSPLLKQYYFSFVVGACHGLLCLYGLHKGYKEWMLFIWNPSIGKSFGIVGPSYHSHIFSYGFGVCPVTKDPTVLNIIQTDTKPWHVEVFTLSSRVWNVIPSTNLPHKSIRLDLKTQVVIDRFIYWGAYEETFVDDGEYITNRMVVSFDLITKEFKAVDLPHNLRNELDGRPVAVANLRESLVVYGSIYVDGAECCSVWVMEHDSSFKKLFTIGAPVYHILGFRKSGEPIFETLKDLGEPSVDVYDPSSEQIKNLEIYGEKGLFFMGSYKESLLLLDHSDSRIYYYNN